MVDSGDASGHLLETKSRGDDASNLENQVKESEGEKSSPPARVTIKAASDKEAGMELKIGWLTAITLPLTKYERSRIVGARALQISLGAPVLIQIPASIIDPIAMADFELKAMVLPITIHRKLPGNRFENIPLSKLATEWI